MILGFDLETASALDINRGAWAYSQHESTIVYCGVFAFADEAGDYDYILWEDGDPWPDDVVAHIEAGGLVLAHNVGFEKSICRNILEDMGFPRIRFEQWRDSQAVGLELNLPMKLEGLAKALGCAVQKDTEGAKVMRSMTKTVWNEETHEWEYPNDTPENREILNRYCALDVGSMLDAWFAMRDMPADEQLLWQYDQRINERGVYLDVEFAHQCAKVAKARSLELADEAFSITAGELVNSTGSPALKKYLIDKNVDLPLVSRKRKDGSYHKTPCADKNAIETLLEGGELEQEVVDLFNNRQEANKTASLSKLDRVPTMVGTDGRLRFSLSYNGTSTGRWIAHGLQVQNMPKVKIDHTLFELVRLVLELGSLEGLKMVADRPLEAISQCLRSVISAPPGKEIVAGDFASVEARGVAWHAGQDDILARFHEGADIYVYTAESIGSDNRQLGKVCTLALGFGMGPLKFINECASWGIPVEPKEAKRIHKLWRENNDKIVAYWQILENAAREAITHKHKIVKAGKVRMWSNDFCFFIRLPSGRVLRYWRPRIRKTTKTIKTINDAGEIHEIEMTSQEIQYYITGKDKGKMQLDFLYGGKLADHVTQATARDLLAESIIRIEDTDPYEVVIHVHDSVATEVPIGGGNVDEFCALMAETPDWAYGMPVAVDGYRDRYFRG